MNAEQIAKTAKSRYYFIDIIRGIAILGMVVHHTLFDINQMMNINVALLNSNVFQSILLFGGCLFIFISGTSTNFSKNNFKRAIQILVVAYAITIITTFFFQQDIILFGILHFLGFAILINEGLKRIKLYRVNAYIGIFIFIILYFVSKNLIDNIGYVQQSWLFPFGLTTINFMSADYFPIVPNIFMFISGVYFGQLVIQNRLPQFIYRIRAKALEWVGAHTLWVYILHQPIILAVLFTIMAFNKT